MITIHMKARGQNISYYDAIAHEYDEMLDKNPDRIIRRTVAEKFSSLVKNAVVLDFGGGTGLDLEWLSGNNPAIYFCEPSAAMREKAISNHSNSLHGKVIFLDGQAADFRRWNMQLPFVAKVDAILSNFAVLNCIGDLSLLFQNLALVVKPGGDMVALVLTKNLMGRSRFINILKAFIHTKPVIVNLRYKKHTQTVYLHSLKAIVKASAKHFDFCSSEVLPATGFTLIHLKRK
jgi:SAM-dependent methyltransferase